MSEKWNEDNIQEVEKSEETWDGDWQMPEGSGVILGEDWQLPEGSGVILGEDWQEPEEAKGSREEIRLHAVARSESLNGFVNRAIRETMARDNKTREE